jgi:hypothetical protein
VKSALPSSARLATLCVSAAAGLFAQCPTTPVLTVTSGASVQAPNCLETSGTVTVTAGTAVNFQAGAAIYLNPGFTAQAGSSFVALIGQPSLSLSINGGSGNGATLPGVTASLAFPISDPAGQNDVAWAQFYLAGSGGGGYCSGGWGRPSALDLYDGNTGVTNGFGSSQSDAFCTVSLASITNSPTDPNSVTVVLIFTINPAYAGTYAVMEQVNYLSGIEGPWQNVGSLVVDSPPGLYPAPTVTLTDNTQSSGYYFVGDSFTLTVSGPTSPPNLPVSVTITGPSGVPVYYGVVGTIQSSGSLSLQSTWTTASVGVYAEAWYVDGVQAGSTLLFSVLSPSSSGPASLPNSYTGAPPALACSDITGNWIVSYGNTQAGYQAEWDLTQNVNGTVQGTLYAPTNTGCGTVLYNVSGGLNGDGSFTLTANQSQNSDACGPLSTSWTENPVVLSGSSCSTGLANWITTGPTYPTSCGSDSWASKKARNANQTPTAAHYNVSYASYIPVDNIPGPRPCIYYGFTNPPVLPGPYFIIYKGDAFRQTYRTTQSVVMIPGASHNYSVFVNTGPTRNYGAASPSGPPDSNGATLGSVALSDIYSGAYAGSDEDDAPGDCYKWNAKGQSATTNMGPSNVTLSYGLANSGASVTFTGSAKDPLEPQLVSPAISWNLTVTINESNPAAPTAQVSGSHTCYPAHIIKVNGTVVYDSLRDYGMPARNTTQYLAECLTGIFAPVQVGIGPTQVNLQ